MAAIAWPAIVPMENDDTRTVDAVLAGDTDAFSGLVRTYEPRVRQYCLTLLRNPVDADEAAQDVFVKAFRSLNGYRRNAAFLTWIGRIAHNHCMDLLRRRTRQKTDSLDAILDEGDAPALERLAEPEPADDADGMKEAVPRLLAALKEEYREILVLREIQDLSYDDIARTLGCTLDTVKSRLRRARADLHDKALKFRKLAGGRS